MKNHKNIGAIYIALGGNLSNQKKTFATALDRLSQQSVAIISVSGLWKSPSWPPGQGHPDYLNAVAKINYDGEATALLDILQATELALGRERSVRNAPRTLDLDIIDFRGQVTQNERLTLPHPRLYGRGFVLFPLAQIAPDWTDPVSGHAINYFTARLPYSDVEPMRYEGLFYTQPTASPDDQTP